MSQIRIDLSYVPSPFTFWNKFVRTVWGFVWLFIFRPSPRSFHGSRRFMLRLFGAKIGKDVHLYPSCKITMPWKLKMGEYSCLGDGVLCYNIGGIDIGAHTTISQNAHLCSSSHDYTKTNMPQTFGKIAIEDQVWICADSFIAPGVTIGQGAVVGARAAVFKKVNPWTIVGGNPAKFIKKREIKTE